MSVFLDTSLKLGALRELYIYVVIYINFPTVIIYINFPVRGFPTVISYLKSTQSKPSLLFVWIFLGFFWNTVLIDTAEPESIIHVIFIHCQPDKM